MQFSIRAVPQFLAFISPCNSLCYSSRQSHSPHLHPTPPPFCLLIFSLHLSFSSVLDPPHWAQQQKDVKYSRINKPEATSKQAENLSVATEPLQILQESGCVLQSSWRKPAGWNRGCGPSNENRLSVLHEIFIYKRLAPLLQPTSPINLSLLFR